MNPLKTEGRWLDVQRRVKIVEHKDGRKERVELPCWYGRLKKNGRWTWFKLFTDRRASQQRWNEIIREQELRQAGVVTPVMDAAQRPLSEHVAEYLESLQRIVTDEHYRIVKYMLGQFVDDAGWKCLADVNAQSASGVLSALQAQGKTVSYTNQYLTRVKAFLNWCIPDRLVANPLAKLRRGNVKKGVKRRARRPLSEAELATLLNSCPANRQLKYAFAAYTGLRRNELEQVRWGDLHLESVIPFIQLRPEQTKTGETTALPLHPFLVKGLKKLTVGEPDATLFQFLPEGRTMLRDLTKAGIKQADASGRRADFHGLRHTFAKRLDATGCSHATRRALMRHGSGDQTDGYTLAGLAEMYEAVKRLPSPPEKVAAQHASLKAAIETKTAPAPAKTNPCPPFQVVTRWTRGGHELTLTGSDPTAPELLEFAKNPRENRVFYIDRQARTATCLLKDENGDIVRKTSPRSSDG